MLTFLITATARRRLLQLLWGEDAVGSAGELAGMADLGFASAYRELKAMLRQQLAVSRRQGGKTVYAANFEHPDAELLRRLAKTRPDMRPPRDAKADQVRGRLRTLGAPLTAEPAEVPFPRERALVEGVQLAHRDPVVARVLPLCFWHQREGLDRERLLLAAKELGEKQAVGFFLELAGVLGHDKRLVQGSRAMRDRRVKAVHDFFDAPTTRVSSAAAEAKTPAVARRWGFRMNMDMESFASLFGTFAHAP